MNWYKHANKYSQWLCGGVYGLFYNICAAHIAHSYIYAVDTRKYIDNFLHNQNGLRSCSIVRRLYLYLRRVSSVLTRILVDRYFLQVFGWFTVHLISKCQIKWRNSRYAMLIECLPFSRNRKSLSIVAVKRTYMFWLCSVSNPHINICSPILRHIYLVYVQV